MKHIGLIVYKEDKDSETTRFRPIDHISKAWEAIAIQLEVDNSKIKNEQGRSRDDASAANEIIKIWLDSDPKASWLRLIKAMKAKEDLEVAAKKLKTALNNMVESDDDED